MAIHEMVISLGLTIGSAAGGYLSEHVGLYAPYWSAFGVIGVGAVAQAAIRLAYPTQAAPATGAGTAE